MSSRAPHILPCALAALWMTATVSAGALGAEIPEHFTPLRPVGMGGAFTAVANDESAIWTNPAGIGRSRKARSRSAFSVAKFPNVIAGANAESRSFWSAFSGSSEKDIEGVVTNLDGLGDKPFWARAAIFPVILFDLSRETPMAFALYSNTTAKALIEKDSPDQARIEAVSDQGAVVTFSLTDKNNRLSVGINARPVWRYAYEDRVETAMLADKAEIKARASANANLATGLGLDIGAMYTIADFWFPTIGITVLNLPTGCREGYLNPFTEKPETVCGTKYVGSFGNEDALSTVDPTDVRAGVAITPRVGRKLSMRFALDVHHIPLGSSEQSYGLQGIEISKLIHGGVELFVGNPLQVSPLSFRAGYGQGFVSVGASANLGFLQLEFASYGRDVSSTEKPIEDRRVMASVSVDF